MIVVAWEEVHADRMKVILRTMAVLARLHVLAIEVMLTSKVAWEKVHAKIIQATLDKAVGKDESLVAKFYGP